MNTVIRIRQMERRGRLTWRFYTTHGWVSAEAWGSKGSLSGDDKPAQKDILTPCWTRNVFTKKTPKIMKTRQKCKNVQRRLPEARPQPQRRHPAHLDWSCRSQSRRKSPGSWGCRVASGSSVDWCSLHAAAQDRELNKDTFYYCLHLFSYV